MVVLAAIQTSKKKTAQDSWQEMGKVILGRGKSVSKDSVTFKEGMRPEEIIAMANARASSSRKV
ncbi:hypothetical protein [Enterobacter kobei]|jgi:hypothetical protein|uniref:hypothetical protein n=1 Tax=Enterobacter kobei TaxID=208224 RepID=UPI00249C4D4D|nr:hypothetical protein [Enterobacter kobei]MDI3139182.1 hypothetical protein [Enterobacter kobei]